MLPDVAGHHIFINDIDQVINMGGPWVGKLYIDHQLITGGCVADNLVHDPETKRLFYVQYHLTQKPNARWYFTVNVLALESRLVKQSVMQFYAVCILAVTAGLVTIVRAFHDRDLSTKISYTVDVFFK